MGTHTADIPYCQNLLACVYDPCLHASATQYMGHTSQFIGKKLHSCRFHVLFILLICLWLSSNLHFCPLYVVYSPSKVVSHSFQPESR